MADLISTPHGDARLHRFDADAPRAVLALLPGASGKIDSADLDLVARTAQEAGITTVLVEPPYAVAGRTSPYLGRRDEEAFEAAVEAVRIEGLPLITGGRSYGSRIACRTAQGVGAVGVLCLAFPLHPPGKPEKSRLGDAEAAGDLPVLVVQGRKDPFGVIPESDTRDVQMVEGDHSLKKDHDVIAARVLAWLDGLLS